MKNLTIAGRLTKDAEQRTQQGGGQAGPVTFSVAVKHRDRKDGQWVESTLFFDCGWFGQRAEKLMQYLTKGVAVCVSGDFGPRSYTKRDGSVGLSLRIRVDQLSLIGGGRRDGQQHAQQQQAPPQQPQQGMYATPPPNEASEFGDDDIPF